MNANITKTEKLAHLNKLRIAASKEPLKAWKESIDKLDTAIAKLEAATAPNTNPANEDLADRGFTDAELNALDAIDTPVTPEATADDAPVIEPTAPELTADFPERLEACLLIYDIPSNVRYRNPSRRLRRIGFRENKSCWVIPSGAVPHVLIADMRKKANANVELIRFDAAEGPRLCKMAIERINRELNDQLTRARGGIDGSADKNLVATDDDNELRDNVSEREAAVKRFEKRANRIVTRLEKLCGDVELAIKNFGVRPELLDVTTVRSAMAVLQTGYEERALAFAAATEALRKLNTPDATALANAIDKDVPVPPEIVADMLKDHGDDATGDRVAETFSLVGNDALTTE